MPRRTRRKKIKTRKKNRNGSRRISRRDLLRGGAALLAPGLGAAEAPNTEIQEEKEIKTEEEDIASSSIVRTMSIPDDIDIIKSKIKSVKANITRNENRITDLEEKGNNAYAKFKGKKKERPLSEEDNLKKRGFLSKIESLTHELDLLKKVLGNLRKKVDKSKVVLKSNSVKKAEDSGLDKNAQVDLDTAEHDKLVQAREEFKSRIVTPGVLFGVKLSSSSNVSPNLHTYKSLAVDDKRLFYQLRDALKLPHQRLDETIDALNSIDEKFFSKLLASFGIKYEEWAGERLGQFSRISNEPPIGPIIPQLMDEAILTRVAGIEQLLGQYGLDGIDMTDILKALSSEHRYASNILTAFRKKMGIAASTKMNIIEDMFKRIKKDGIPEDGVSGHYAMGEGLLRHLQDIDSQLNTRFAGYMLEEDPELVSRSEFEGSRIVHGGSNILSLLCVVIIYLCDDDAPIDGTLLGKIKMNFAIVPGFISDIKNFLQEHPELIPLLTEFSNTSSDMDLYFATPHPDVTTSDSHLFKVVNMAIAKTLRSMMADPSIRELFPGLKEDLTETHSYKLSLFTSGEILTPGERTILLSMFEGAGMASIGLQTACDIDTLNIFLHRHKMKPNFSLTMPEGGENIDIVVASLKNPTFSAKLLRFLKGESFTVSMIRDDLDKTLKGKLDDKSPVRVRRLELCEILLKFYGIDQLSTFMGMVICGQVTRE